MKKSTKVWISVLLGFVGLYHLVAGTVLIYSGEWAIALARAFSGWTVQGSPELGILGEILGCYLITFGLVMLLAARDPVKHRPLLALGTVLFCLRLFQRAFFAHKVMQVFQVTPQHYWGAFGFIAVLAVLVAFSTWACYRS